MKASIDLVSRSDPKGVYKTAKKNGQQNIVGLDIKWNEPLMPHIVIDRDKGVKEEEALKEILSKIPLNN